MNKIEKSSGQMGKIKVKKQKSKFRIYFLTKRQLKHLENVIEFLS